MEIKDILSRCDHTLLIQTATEEDIKALCDDGIKYGVASVCIPPCYVKFAKEYLDSRLPVCTVIGFPNGYSTTETKVFEAREAVANGADEIDMVINLGMLKSQNYQGVLAEIKAVRAVTMGKILKVIVEACLLSEEEKVKMCEIVSQSGANYIKTSTGFSLSGATPHDVDLFEACVSPWVKVKAAGGIRTLADAEDFINRGADRLGTSKIVKLLKAAKGEDADY